MKWPSVHCNLAASEVCNHIANVTIMISSCHTVCYIQYYYKVMLVEHLTFSLHVCVFSFTFNCLIVITLYWLL
jgi:hypothetical protein